MNVSVLISDHTSLALSFQSLMMNNSYAEHALIQDTEIADRINFPFLTEIAPVDNKNVLALVFDGEILVPPPDATREEFTNFIKCLCIRLGGVYLYNVELDVEHEHEHTS